MKKISLSFLFMLVIVTFSFHSISQNSHAQTDTKNIEPENPPGYVPPTAEQLQSQMPPQAQGSQTPPPPAATSAGQAKPQNFINAPPPANPAANAASNSGTSEQQTPPSQPNFQNPSDIVNAVKSEPNRPNSNDPNFTTPADGPLYPSDKERAADAEKNKSTNQVIEVTTNKKDDKKVFAVIRTSMGVIKVKLLPQYAPRTVKNFIELATGQKEFVEATTSKKSTRPFYNGQVIFKVIRDFVVQMGCPFGDGRGGPGYEISDEFSPYLHHNKAGIVSMANHGPNTAGSQFFITLSPQPSFDEKYSIFGEVVSGLDVVFKISKVRVGPTSRPVKRIVLQRVDIETK